MFLKPQICGHLSNLAFYILNCYLEVERLSTLCIIRAIMKTGNGRLYIDTLLFYFFSKFSQMSHHLLQIRRCKFSSSFGKTCDSGLTFIFINLQLHWPWRCAAKHRKQVSDLYGRQKPVSPFSTSSLNCWTQSRKATMAWSNLLSQKNLKPPEQYSGSS